jgi:hypothetical protein
MYLASFNPSIKVVPVQKHPPIVSNDGQLLLCNHLLNRYFRTPNVHPRFLNGQQSRRHARAARSQLWSKVIQTRV